MTEQQDQQKADDEFFVGYLPTPRRLTRFSLLTAVGFAVLLIAGGAAFALLQRSPGKGLERGKYGTKLVGLVQATPYPVLTHIDDNNQVRHVLLVRGGKYGTRKVEDKWLGQAMVAQGLLLRRDGSTMMEVGSIKPSGDQSVLSQSDRQRLEQIQSQSLGELTLQGEIVDSKCHLGRMRPGQGQAHRACAQYCVRSGIPPIFVVPQKQGPDQLYLLTDKSGKALSERVLEYLAEDVEVSGQGIQLGELRILSIDPGAIRRL